MKRNVICCVLVLALGPMLAACAPSSTQGPATWLDQPLDGARLPLGPQEVTAHASDDDGVASLEIYVDSALLVHAPVGGGVLEDTTVGWNPGTPGIYTISVNATDSQGNLGAEARSVVTVGEVVSPSPAIPSVGPASSPMPLTVTPMPPTVTPVPPTMTPIPPTLTPLPPTATPIPPTVTPIPPPPPIIVSFFANPAQVQEGGCTTVSWRVEGNPTAIYFDGEGVTSPDSRNKCPSETIIYTLVARGPGGEVSQSLTVSVIADTEGPSIGNVQQSENYVYCLTQPMEIEITAGVSDPSGISSVDLYCTLVGEGGEEWCGAFSGNGSSWSVTYVPLEHAICSGTMNYRIRATDDSARGNVTWWGTSSFGIANY